MATKTDIYKKEIAEYLVAHRKHNYWRGFTSALIVLSTLEIIIILALK